MNLPIKLLANSQLTIVINISVVYNLFISSINPSPLYDQIISLFNYLIA
jgi:hypothetical protein